MKLVKFFVPATLAAALMGALAVSSASATELTCEPGVMCLVGTVIHATSEGATVIDTSIGNIECHTTFEGATTNTGGSSETVVGNITSHTFSNCNATVRVLKTGTFEIHTDESDPLGGHGNGTITSTGTEITVEVSGFHCIFSTKDTTIGTITGSTERALRTATIDLEGFLPVVGGRSGIFCGSSAPSTGFLTIEKPDFLDVDHPKG